MPKIDLPNAPSGAGSSYPAPFDEPCRGRSWHRLGVAAGLTHLGVNLVRLTPGAWSSQRHWHTHEDEFVYVLSGELVLVTDDGEEVLVAGDSAGFPAGVRNGHCLQNRSTRTPRSWSPATAATRTAANTRTSTWRSSRAATPVAAATSTRTGALTDRRAVPRR